MKKEQLEKLKEMIEAKIEKLQKADVIEIAKNNGKIAIELSSIKYILQEYMIKLKLSIDTKYYSLFKKFKFDSHYLAKTKAEVESLIYEDEEYIGLLEKYQQVKALYDYLSDILQILKTREYTISTLIQKELFEEV